MNIRTCSLAMFLLFFPTALSAQSAFDAWITNQIQSSLQKQNVGQNGKGTDRQTESPSTDPRSTSLVDESSATDFLSIAANVIPVAPGISQLTSGTGTASSSPSATGSTTATASLYAFMAALNGTGPTDPAFYARHVFSRRISFTIGTAASQQATDNTTTPAGVFGTKFLIINHRELYTKRNVSTLGSVQQAVSKAAVASAALKQKVKELIFVALHPSGVNANGTPNADQFLAFDQASLSDSAFQGTINGLADTTRKQIQSLIGNYVESFSGEQTALQNAYDSISQGMQMSVSYTADVRSASGYDVHRAELIFDYGLSKRINWTFNASADYTDRKLTAADSLGGRAATEFQGNLTNSPSPGGRGPIQLSFSGEAQWLSIQKPQYTFQAKLTIPISAGLDLPIVYQYANRTALLNQTDSEAKLGLSVDISRLAQALK